MASSTALVQARTHIENELAATHTALARLSAAVGAYDALVAGSDPEFLTVTEVARRLSLSPGHVRDLIYSHRLEAHREGRRVLVPAPAFERYVRLAEGGAEIAPQIRRAPLRIAR